MAPPPSHSQSLLPNPDILILDRIDQDVDRFLLRVHVEQKPACPVCGEVSRSRHSCYCRCLQDFGEGHGGRRFFLGKVCQSSCGRP
jgi:hypothetical protein